MTRSLNILVVDDEQIVLDSVKKHLRKTDVQLHFALSAQKGLNIMEQEPIDIVLTDLMMSEIDGLELMKIIKSKSPGTPIIMITGYATISTALQAQKLGAFDYIAKPFTKAELVSVVRRASEMVLASNPDQEPHPSINTHSDFRHIGESTWISIQDDGTVNMGVDRAFLEKTADYPVLYLPAERDEIRQGAMFMQLLAPDRQTHTVLSPLSGSVVAVNESIRTLPKPQAPEDQPGLWVIRLTPSKFKYEIQNLGLTELLK